jgi:hypothetical protein
VEQKLRTDYKIYALRAVFDAVNRWGWEHDDTYSNNIARHEAIITLSNLIACESSLSSGELPRDLPLTERTGYDVDKTLPENIDLAIAAYLPDYAEKLPGLGYDGSELAVSYVRYNTSEEKPDVAWQTLEPDMSDEPMAAASLVDPLRALVLMRHYYNLIVVPIEHGSEGKPRYDWSSPDTLEKTGVIAPVVQLCMRDQTVVYRCVPRQDYDATNHVHDDGAIV